MAEYKFSIPIAVRYGDRDSQMVKEIKSNGRLKLTKLGGYAWNTVEGEAFWRAGGNGRDDLIGPGVNASHIYERTHTDTLVATTDWLLAYLMN